MTDLKTLKDLPADYESHEIDVFKEELKHEAVKWVKGDRALFEFFDMEGKLSPVAKFIIYFFDLTEEDLK